MRRVSATDMPRCRAVCSTVRSPSPSVPNRVPTTFISSVGSEASPARTTRSVSPRIAWSSRGSSSIGSTAPSGVSPSSPTPASSEASTCPDQPEHSLLDEVGEGQPLALVLPGHGHDQPKVGVDQEVLCLQVAALDALGKLQHLLVRKHGVALRPAQ